MSIVIVEGDGSFDATLAAVLNDLTEAPGDTVMGLYHYGDLLEAAPADALGAALEREYRTAHQFTGVARFGQALRRAAARLRSGEDLLATDFLWGVAISMRYCEAEEQCVRLVAVGLDGTVHWCTAKGRLAPDCVRIPDGIWLLGSDPVVAGLDVVLDAAVRERDRNCRTAVAALIEAIRGGEGLGDGHAAFGIRQMAGDYSATTLQGATEVLDRHLAAAGELDSAIELAAAELATAPGRQSTNDLIGAGLVNIDRTGPAPMIVANAVVGTRVHLAAWPLDAPAPVEQTWSWHDIAPENQRFTAALRDLAAALRRPAA